jgi:hypothetical protein
MLMMITMIGAGNALETQIPHILFCQIKRKKDHYDSSNKFSENDIINMLVFLIENKLAIFGERIYT